jgi:hypothetical protein
MESAWVVVFLKIKNATSHALFRFFKYLNKNNYDYINS